MGGGLFKFGALSLYYRFIDKQYYNKFLNNLFCIKATAGMGQGVK